MVHGVTTHCNLFFGLCFLSVISYSEQTLEEMEEGQASSSVHGVSRDTCFPIGPVLQPSHRLEPLN